MKQKNITLQKSFDFAVRVIKSIFKPFSQEETFNSVIFPELEVDLNKIFEV